MPSCLRVYIGVAKVDNVLKVSVASINESSVVGLRSHPKFRLVSQSACSYTSNERILLHRDLSQL